MRILITGSSGQIGTNLGLYLMDNGHDVIGVDIRPNPWTNAFPTLLQDLTAPLSDVHGGLSQTTHPDRPDIVVHFAAHAKVHELVVQPARAIENIAMTFNVLEYCRVNNLPIIFSSSREVYGDIHRYITEEAIADFAYTESPYSASKIAGEALIYSYARCYGVRYLVFRFSNVYGRYDADIERMERVIPLFIRKISRGEPIVIYGKTKLLDFTYVDDCVSGVYAGIKLLAEKRAADETINLAYGQGNSLIKLAEHIGEALGVAPQMTIQPARVGEVTHYVADIRKAQALLGYAPQTPLSLGVRHAVAWATGYWAESL
ncbi:MAG TPA: NAD-dependent epimerase/dehydratase family protein [Promineifilum sp.]